MISSTIRKWSIVMFTAAMAAPQYPMPYYPQYQPMINMVPVPPPQPVPVPVPVPIPIGIVLQEETTTQTTTTTTEKSHNENNNMLKIYYLPWPPYYWQMPNYPCQKYPAPNITIPLSNCENHTFRLPPQTPQLMPAPYIMPPHPPVIMMPLRPRMIQYYPGDRSCAGSGSSSSSSSSSDDSDDSTERCMKNKFDVFRRSNRFLNIRRNFGDIQPVLSYVSEDGEVKFRKRLSRKAAAKLLTDTKPARDIPINTGYDFRRKSREVVVASPQSTLSNLTKKIVMRSSLQETGYGNKEIVFKTPNNTKITNLSVSFRVIR